MLQKVEILSQGNTHEELISLFNLIIQISNNHCRNGDFPTKVEKILCFFCFKFQSILSNEELFNICCSNKQFLHILLKNNIIKIDQSILNYIMQEEDYRQFFYYEIKPFINEEQRKSIENELCSESTEILKIFDHNHDLSENDTYICKLIRQDLIEEFIIFVNKTNLSLNKLIEPSIFETNSFLNEQENVTLIEYSTFFGSIQVFNYLRQNNVKLTPSLWLYAVHSNNPELIHILEDNHVLPEDSSYENCFLEAIKCHHNDVANYVKDNLLVVETKWNNSKYYYDINRKYSYIHYQPQQNIESFFEYVFKYHNYSFFPEKTNVEKTKYNYLFYHINEAQNIKIPDNFDHEFVFYYLCCYNYNNMINLYMQTKMEDIKSRLNTILIFVSK